MSDQFEPRIYQKDLVRVMLANIAANRHLTIGLAAPGSGKQFAGVLAHVELVRNGYDIPLSITFVPRLNLAAQYEIDYEGPYRRGTSKRDRADALIEKLDLPRLNHFEHRANSHPLIPDGWIQPFGIVACYASLVKDMGGDGKGYFRALAKRFKGKFFLHADEAQFCGAAEWGEGDAITGGVRAGAYIEELDHYSFHTLLQTGTPDRADREELVLCHERYYDPERPGEIRGPLMPDAEATYGDGREQRYLRSFEWDKMDDHVVLRSLDGSRTEEYELSEDAKYLAGVLRKDQVWEPLCDQVAKRLNERQKIWPGYKALVCCMDQAHARMVLAYYQRRHPHLRILLAISQDQGEARKNLQLFRADRAPFDVLITVRMAFIGYDCKAITVVGILTSYRDQGHLYQQIGRALRVLVSRDYDEQVCWIVAPADPGMQRFITWLKDEEKRGIRGGGSGPGPGEPTMYVESAKHSTTTADGLTDTITNPQEFAQIEYIRREIGLYEPATKLRRFLDLMWNNPGAQSEDDPEPLPSGPVEGQLTSRELIAEYRSDTTKIAKEALKVGRVYPGNGNGYTEAMNWFYNKVAGLSYYSGDDDTPEKANARKNAARQVLEQCQSRGGVGW